MQARFCPQCGNQIPVDAAFCPACGFQTGGQKSPEMAGNNVASVKVTAMLPQNPNQVGVVANNSPGNLVPGQRCAEPGERFIAFIIDMVFVSIITSILLIGGNNAHPASFLGVDSVIALLYFWIAEMVNDGKGQTIGKAIMKIRTVDETTQGKINPIQALLHVIGKAFFLPIDVILGLIVTDSEKKRPGFVDKCMVRVTQRISHTVVIKV